MKKIIICFWIALSSCASLDAQTSERETPMQRQFREGFAQMEEDFRRGFAYFDSSFAEMDRQFAGGFARMEEDFRRGFAGMDQEFKKAFKNMNVDTTLTVAERDFAVAYLVQSQAKLQETLNGLTDAQLSYRSGENRWSIAECMEHIALVEEGLFQRTMGALKMPADLARRSEINVSDQQVIERLTNRQGKATAPEIVQPANRFPTTAQALAAFNRSRERTIQYVKTTSDNLRQHYGLHPATGTIDAYQQLLLLAAHGERHRLQIEEIKADPGFPTR